MTFRFRLEKVLHWKRSLCELEEFKTRQAIAELKVIESAIERLATERLGSQRAVLDTVDLRGGDLQRIAAWNESIGRQKAVLTRSRHEADRRLSEQRARWLIVLRESRTIEALRNRRIAEYNYEQNRNLEVTATEGYLSRWWHKQ